MARRNQLEKRVTLTEKPDYFGKFRSPLHKSSHYKIVVSGESWSSILVAGKLQLFFIERVHDAYFVQGFRSFIHIVHLQYHVCFRTKNRVHFQLHFHFHYFSRLFVIHWTHRRTRLSQTITTNTVIVGPATKTKSYRNAIERLLFCLFSLSIAYSSSIRWLLLRMIGWREAICRTSEYEVPWTDSCRTDLLSLSWCSPNG